MKPTRHFQKSAFALSLLAFACIASAQGSVTIYGIVDAGLRYGDGLSAANAAFSGSTTGINSGINNTSRLGFRGSEDLGGGMRAVFNLEAGLNIDTGAQANATKFFDRGSHVGLQTHWGTVTLGRQTSVLADALGPVDPLGVRFAGFNPNVAIAALSAHKLGLEYGPSGANTGSYRLDNSIKYVGKFSDFTVRAIHALGEQSGDAAKLSSSGVGLGYQSESYAATLGYEQFESAAGLTLKGYVGGVSGKLGSSKISLTYGSHEGETSVTAKTRNTTLGLGGTFPLSGSVDLIVAHYRVNRTRTANVDDGFNRNVAFLEYKLSKRTRLYAELDQTNWKDGYQGVGLPGTGSGASLGMVHSF